MEKRKLGQTGLLVSRLCFGSLTLSPLQANLSYPESARLIEKAIDLGINFIDTADYYQNYSQIAEGIKHHKHDVIVCSKTYAYRACDARRDVEKALKMLKRDYIDLFCLHEQESALTLKGHAEALQELNRMKEEGKIRAIGISTHHIAAVQAAINHPLIEVVHAITNYSGLGIVDGSMDDMRQAITKLHHAKKGVYGMKPLGGGHLHHHVTKALDYVLDIPELASIALGMQDLNELEANVSYFNNQTIPEHLNHLLERKPRKLHIAAWCTGCGRCVKRCDNQALSLVNKHAVVDSDLCVLCGYCGGVCPDFCIKIF